MSPDEIRAKADQRAPRTLVDGSINPQHVAIESTLRGRYGHPGYIADLDGPGRYRITMPAPEYDADEGRLILERYADGAVKAAIEVRARLEDDALIAVIVIELRRRGYTVTPPVAGS